MHHSPGFIIVLYFLLYISITYFKGSFLKMSLFLHFSSTHIHQLLQFYYYLYTEGFYRGVCSYNIHLILLLHFICLYL